MYAIFNQSEDSDKPDNRPNLAISTPQELQKRTGLAAKIAQLEKELLEPNPKFDEAQAKWEQDKTARAKASAPIKKILAMDAKKRSDGQKLEVAKYYRSTLPELHGVQKQLT